MPAPPVGRTFYLLLAAGLACAANVFANVGDSVKEATDRYGSSNTVAAMKPAEEAHVYSAGNLRILVSFWKGQSSGEQYRKVDAGVISAEDTAALLKANAGQSSWQAASGDSWVRDDLGALAFLADNQRAFIVQSYAFHVEAQRQKKLASEFGVPRPLFQKVARPPMTKIVYRKMTPGAAPDSFAAKQKTIYLAGDSFARVEEELDPDQHLRKLIICNEPNVWLINLASRSGKHLVDAGPDFVVRNPLLPADAPAEMASLELGRESEFFQAHRIAPMVEQAMDGQQYETLEFKQANYRVVLKVAEGTRKPLKLDFVKNDQTELSIIYVSYETELPFRSGLFDPPPDVTITEARVGTQ